MDGPEEGDVPGAAPGVNGGFRGGSPVRLEGVDLATFGFLLERVTAACTACGLVWNVERPPQLDIPMSSPWLRVEFRVHADHFQLHL